MPYQLLDENPSFHPGLPICGLSKKATNDFFADAVKVLPNDSSTFSTKQLLKYETNTTKKTM